jgi:hypothetical protein
VPCTFPLRERLLADPFAPPAFTGFITTMSQSDFWQTFGVSPFTRLQLPLPYFRNLSDLPGMQTLLCTLATLSDPGGTYGILAYRTRIAACDQKESIGFRTVYLTGLYRFTLLHCGSCTPLPTLKPHLAATAPRLCTGCLLGFTGRELSPRCIVCTEPAHPSPILYHKFAKKTSLRWTFSTG